MGIACIPAGGQMNCKIKQVSASCYYSFGLFILTIEKWTRKSAASAEAWKAEIEGGVEYW